MELFKSLENRTKSFSDPFDHFEINEPLTESAIKEISEADVLDPKKENLNYDCLLYTSPSPRDKRQSRMPSSA